MTGVNSSRGQVLAGVLVLALALSGCGKGGKSNSDDNKPTPGPAVDLTVTPADNATGVAVSEEIGITVGRGKVTEVKLADAAGAAVKGELREDASTWVPASPLKYTTAYTVSVTAKPDGEGEPVTKTSKFTTMDRPGNRMEAQLFMANGRVYGQAMPIVVEFKGGVKKANRAAVERRLFVKSDPPQPGVWSWDSDIQVEYRPKEYWRPGTKLTVRLGLGGLPIGDGRYGQIDININASIDTVRRSIEVDNNIKQLVALQDGQIAKTMPVSLGKPSKPSFSGTFVIIERLESTVFDSSTYGTPVNSADGYRTAVKHAERLTWDGQFIHAAPWSEGVQGRTNVSHGCVNISAANGQWMYGWVRVGDPVVIRNTETTVGVGNGWTAWNVSWEQHIAGSALPQPGATPSPSSS
jgi:lipoprotein-anchoring transpeptidase ErfK/SrfK